MFEFQRLKVTLVTEKRRREKVNALVTFHMTYAPSPNG
jgi:hypothetical protein